MAGLEKPEYVSFRDLVIGRKPAVPSTARRLVLDKYARTIGTLDELDEEACQVVYITKPKEEIHPDIDVKNEFRALAERLCEKHQGISTEREILQGMPHLKDMRIGVGHVLSHLHTLGSVDDVVQAYSPYVTREQVKEAIAYVKDFLEEACDPTPPHSNG